VAIGTRPAFVRGSTSRRALALEVRRAPRPIAFPVELVERFADQVS
jgi:hypothetical protein